ncbi:MAG: hypothetical protein WCI88_04925 [Chloroflexota bacterium]
MFSIYHFWKNLFQYKTNFLSVNDLEDFPFNTDMLSCKNKGIFPDLAIRINQDRLIFNGGELIELKDSMSYTVSSFNSTIPTRRKKIKDLILTENSSLRQKMEDAGDDVFSLPEREVYYLVRGRKKGHTKVCLVHGSFFETIHTDELIQQSFSQVLVERVQKSGLQLSDRLKAEILSIFTDQRAFSKVRDIQKSSVKLRFRIMSEVKPEGNILNARIYPQIEDDTLNFVLPFYSPEENAEHIRKLKLVLSQDDFESFKVLTIKHPLNGEFVVFQSSLS